MEIPKLNDLNAEHWNYIAEGNANIVIGYNGPYSEQLTGKVIRIQKKYVQKKDSTQDLADILLYKRFIEGIIQPILTSKLIDPGIIVKLNTKFIEEIKQKINPKRPEYRKKIANISTEFNLCNVQQDYTQGILNKESSAECLCVELKPKMGFIINTPFMREEYNLRKKISHFQMVERTKMKKGLSSKISGYEPLELFSNDKEQIFKSIQDLLNTPNINLRLFYCSKLIFGGCYYKEENDQNPLLSINNLLKTINPFCGDLDNLKELIYQAFEKTQALQKLLNLQKMDTLDIDGLIHIWNRLKKEEIELEEWKHFVGNTENCENLKLLIMETLAGIEENNRKIPQTIEELNKLSIEECKRYIQEFLIAGAAKDCSIMITFQKTNQKQLSEKSIKLGENGPYFDFNLAIIDMEPRPIERIEKYYDLFPKIVKDYIEIEKK
ncbi:inositol polyphosphate kinase 1 [Anaeramoeba flamelloides]|uniref:Inositol-pentakisphosphate 2-kinase n=1 Tax=Anaeramoeba flamelloides TaxID=1746091 RepID=A0ABQ8Y206_9EUKA|nr:inositol polyphosphate kinase 1 [Anaeramoeba flamelloides]